MTTEHGGPESLPPGASPRARRFARMLASPIERFLHIQAASGIILLFNGVIALAWANSAWASTYAHILHTPISLGLGELAFVQPVHFWINDVLMVIFFFVVGLEVRRELFEGELSELRRASLPVAAALGGMLVPAAIYLSINAGAPTVRGWGTPMATDIAFAVGVLALLGRRVPASLRVLLLAVAIIDDIGAILVIALFYSSGLVWTGLGIAGIGILLVLLMQRIGVRSPPLYVVPGLVIWSGILHAGIHPTIAGVILGLLTPARSWFGPEGFVTETQLALDRLREKARTETDPRAYLPEIDRINVARRESIPPVTLIESALHPWVAFGIMPLFALANAGVSLEGLGSGGTATTGIVLGVGLGLMLGKPLGIIAFSWLAVRLGLASLPRGVSWSGVLVVGLVSGIGFTMALFIAALAFPDPTMLGVAKISVLLASAIAGVLALIVGFWTLPVLQASDAASITPANAEASTEH